MRIAILQRDPYVANRARVALTRAGHRCWVFTTRAGLVDMLARSTFDLLLLDWSTPDAQGLELVRWIKQDSRVSLTPVFYTDHFVSDDIALAFEAGAADYIIKPVEEDELVARVLVQLRRSYPGHFGEGVLEIGPFRIERDTKKWWYHGRNLDLTATEFGLALCLLVNLGRPMSRDYIQEFVTGESTPTGSRSLDSQLSTIRIKLRLMPERGFQLRALYGYGYRLDQTPVREAAADGRVRLVDWSTITNVSINS
ncbi:MAG: response regulator transcription factor [Burkholderiaceae bacterium]|jgi:DNA-binding response OmpR family regulator